ncbi:phosphate transport system regulatory protein PhoU [Methanosarcinales archaeon]|nr:MAG: phosphate transport system regulatory protein PhoU [Methanosarcinales archaeon]
MTRTKYHQQLQKLKEDTIRMSNMARDNIQKAVASLKHQNLDEANEVINSDDEIDKLYATIEDTCFALLALQQPMAKDLRLIGSIIKIIIDLERIGDLALEIAWITRSTIKQPHIKPLVDLPRMAKICGEMLTSAMQAFESYDSELAKQTAKRDDEIDALFDQVRRELITYMIEDPTKIKNASHLTFAARYLERSGDHITNVCESVVYMVTGERIELN